MNQKKSEYLYGIKRGLPIAIGYIPVAFTFGLMAVSGGLPVWVAVLISLTNLTSAGQFAGTNLILAQAGTVEIGITVFIINIRYMLMSLSLSQRLKPGVSILKRMIFGFGITDETFVVASMESGALSYSFMLGLITLPIAGWTVGTAAGALICSALPKALSLSLGIALYGMFIAIIIPAAKHSRAVFIMIALSVLIVCLLRYIPAFSFISSGFRIITAAVLAAAVGAVIFPVKEEKADEPS